MHYASDASIEIVGDWEKKIETSLTKALQVSMDVFERTGMEALKHAIILMAKSAAVLTAKSPKLRKVQTNQAGAKFIESFQQGDPKPHRMYQFQFLTKDPKWKLDGTWEKAKRIRNSGLAKRSWMWGLGKLGASVSSSAIPGTSKVYALTGGQVKGYIKENRLGYISAPGVMPSGWETLVESLVTNRILGQARAKMAGYWKSGRWAENHES